MRDAIYLMWANIVFAFVFTLTFMQDSYWRFIAYIPFLFSAIFIICVNCVAEDVE